MGRVLALRHHLEDHPGLIGEAFEAAGHPLTVVMMNEETGPLSLDGYDYLLVLGSKSAVYDEEVRAAWFQRELDLIAEAERTNVPVLGICFGAQALCVSFGGRVARSPRPEIGWYEVTSDEPGLPSGQYFEYHFDECHPAENVRVIARNENAVQAFEVGRHLAVQFHPEVDAAQLNDWFVNGASDETREFGHDIEALLAASRDIEPAARARATALVQYFLSR